MIMRLMVSSLAYISKNLNVKSGLARKKRNFIEYLNIYSNK